MRGDRAQTSGTRRSARGTSFAISVLVVDDDVVTHETVGVILEHAGYTVATCANGHEALAMLTIIRPFLILLDTEMPVMNGAEFREHQRRDHELIRIPTIVMTDANATSVLDLGVAAVLHKPVGSTELLDAVRIYCSPLPA